MDLFCAKKIGIQSMKTETDCRLGVREVFHFFALFEQVFFGKKGHGEYQKYCLKLVLVCFSNIDDCLVVSWISSGWSIFSHVTN